MAAEALTSVLLKKLVTGSFKQVGKVLGVQSDLEKLESALSAIQAVISAAEERSVTERDVRDWVAKLKDAAYDADDLLDEFQTYAERRNRDSSMSNKVRIFFSPRSNPLAFRIKMSFKIKAIVEKLDMIAQERTRYHLREVPLSLTDLQHDTDTRSTTPVIVETNIYGRDDDVEKLVRLLLEEEADKDISVVTVVGIGGLGKTTLAQLVYNDERVVKQESFDSRIWVYVSDKFDVKRIATSIIEFATDGKCDLSELAPIVNRVQQILRGKRFLLVLDDVWNENEQEWEKLRGFLAVGAQGSKIVATTRSDKVASVMGSISAHHLGVLSEDDCWRLFEKRAFKTEDTQRDPSLEAIGRQIVAKCGGSPLAAKSMGSLMHFKRGRGEWLAERDSDVWRSTVEGNQVMASLRLSYNHLSPGLKQCFAYCCIFPNGTIINRDELILHWISMGFIPYNKILESTINKGKEYFNSLVWISFLDEDKHSKSYEYGIQFYKMHDLVHDLAKLVAGDEHFTCYAGQKVAIPPRCRFCTLVGTFEELKLKDLFRKFRKIRALLLLEFNSNNSISISFTNLSRLRVLYIVRSPIKKVHASINRLQHLRCLVLKGNLHISQLPSSIDRLQNLLAVEASGCFVLGSLPQSFTRLQNLHTLDLSFCVKLGSLPASLDGLQSLQILRLTGCDNLVSLPESIGKLANLRTLRLSWCETLQMLPQSLGNLSNMEELDLEGCQYVVSLPESIGKLANLRTLRLSWCKTLQMLPQSLGNLSNMEELDLKMCQYVVKLPESIGKLANLRTLKLSYCESLQMLPQSLSNLSNLEELYLEGCSSIAELPEGMENMTSLRHLKNTYMTSLRGMPLGIGKMTSLVTLQLFVVGEGIDHGSIAELQHLNLIEGELELTHLENVKAPGDAARANMKEKHRLERLCLRWSGLMPHDPCSLKHEEVLADLIPHPNLKYLEIERYPDINFPNWLSMMSASVPNLVWLKLCGLKCLPPFVGSLLQLKELFLSDMPDVEEWLTAVAAVDLYPSLVYLIIQSCPKMHAEPCIPASVKKLELDCDSRELLNSAGRVVEGVDHLQDVSGAALEELVIWDFDEIVDLPECIRRFTLLRSLGIHRCPNLARLPEWLRELTSLNKLTITECSSSLRDWCKEDTGEGWPIIAHIPTITFE